MELRNIKSFIKVAEFENFSKAAEVLGYAQSTITLQIQQLEQELGVNLFDRIGKRVLLSEKGRAFLSYANDMVQLEVKPSKPFPKIPPLQAPCASARLNLSPAPFCPCFWKNI